MIIDTHQHFWKYNKKEFGWMSDEMASLKRDFLPDDIAASMKQQKISHSVAVQARQTEEETDFLLHLAQNNSFIAGVVGWVDLRADNVQQRLDYFNQFEKIKGFRHIVEAEPDDQFLMRTDFRRGIKALGNQRLTYDILIQPHQLDAAIALVSQYRDQKFVIDHLAKPNIKNGEITDWAKKMKQFAGMDHVYCKISGMVTEADWESWEKSDFYPYMDLVLEVFGTERILLGSDWPVCTLAANTQEVWDIARSYLKQFSEQEYQKICYDNALYFYDLDIPNVHSSNN